MTKVLSVEVPETDEGITGNTLTMEWTGNDAEDTNALSDLFNDAIMTEGDYDKLVDIWNLCDTAKNTLIALKKAALIDNFEIEEVSD